MNYVPKVGVFRSYIALFDPIMSTIVCFRFSKFIRLVNAMIYCQYEHVIAKYTTVQVKLLQGVTHMGLVVSSEVRPVIKEWLEGLGRP